ncbi:MAG: glutathione S-transferase family protein [Proteobacteria bacterium]|nr:MAG: glutathione S-transferase family protein [Pseudomonadota bacterium]
MKLYGASPSHFTRKVRVVLHELGLQFEFAALSRLLEATPDAFGENPLLQMPVLEDRGYRLIESDLICEYLIERYGKKQVRFYPIKGDGILHRQRLAIMNGGMGAGAKIMRAKRSAIPNFDDYAFFKQERASLTASLEWLDKDLGPRLTYAAEEFTLLEISLMCFVEWAPFREMVPNLDAYPNLKRFQAHWHEHASFAATRPSLAVPA